MRSPRSTFLTALGAGTASAALPRAVRAQTAKLRLGAPVSDAFAEPFFAQAAGGFNRIGIEIEAQNLSNAGAVVAAVAGGSLDLGVGDLVSSSNAVNRGVPIQMIAAGGLYLATEPTTFLCVAKDSAIHAPRDLEGKTIAVPTLVGLTTVAVHAWLAQNKIDSSKVKIIELTAASTPAAIARGTIDAGLFGEPFFTRTKSEIREIGRPFDAVAKEFLFTAWFAAKSWIDADRERAKRVVGAIYDTARWSNAHRAETLVLYANNGKMDIEPIRAMARTEFATAIVPAQVQAVLDVGQKYKLIEKPVDLTAFIAKL
jgi:NitT/TauT family transport system substrate-binding protein